MSLLISPVLFHLLLAKVISRPAIKTLHCCLVLFACYSLLLLSLLARTPLNKTFYLYSVYYLKKGSTCNAIHPKHKLDNYLCSRKVSPHIQNPIVTYQYFTRVPLEFKVSAFSIQSHITRCCSLWISFIRNNLNALSMHAVLTVWSRNCGIKDNLKVDWF